MQASVNRVRRLIYVTTRDHAYTFQAWPALLAPTGIEVQRFCYEQWLPAARTPVGTYVLTDFDRLSVSELQVAGELFQTLVAAGMTVLNDPRQFRPRAFLLKQLQRSGINTFGCHLPAAGEWPDRFPVFLRTLAGHRGVLSELLHDGTACQQALEAALAQGFTLSDLAFITFAATPSATGAFQKHAAYRIGDRIVRAVTVNQRHWMAKVGELGVASEAQYREELTEMDHYPHAAFVHRVFDAAGSTFGRLDFGLTDAGPQAYEINTNPHMGSGAPDELMHPNADRSATMQRIRRDLIEAFGAQVPPHPRGWIRLRDQRRPVPRV